MTLKLPFLVLVLAGGGCRAPEPAEDFTRSREESLFNGQDLTGWRVVTGDDFAGHGQVRVAQRSVILEAGDPLTGISLERELPGRSYEVQLEARRMSGRDFFCGMTFPVGDEHCTWIAGGWGGGVVGLSNVDGLNASENSTTSYREFEQGRWYFLRLRVTSERIEAWIDADKVVDLSREGRKLSIWPQQESVLPFGIASYYTTAELRGIRLRIIPPGAVQPAD